MNSAREKFLNSTSKQMDDVIAKETKYHSYKIEKYKQFWTELKWSPYTYFILISIIFVFACYGISCDWAWKNMIDKAFGYVIASVLTAVIEYIIIKVVDKNETHA
jgi:hypothetical protein